MQYKFKIWMECCNYLITNMNPWRKLLKKQGRKEKSEEGKKTSV